MIRVIHVYWYQVNPTENTTKRVGHFLDFIATNPNINIRYYSSDMILNVYFYTSYLTIPITIGRAGCHLFLNSIPKDGSPICYNGVILINYTIPPYMAVPSMEVYLGSLFLNTTEAKITKFSLEDMVHSQPPTPIYIDNTTAIGIIDEHTKRQQPRTTHTCYV